MDVPSEGSEVVSALLHRLQDVPPGDAECIGIIRSILPHVSKLEGNEAQDFIDVLDGALDSTQTDPDLFRKCLRALRKICGRTGMLPPSHLLTEGLTKRGEVPIASGGFADIWDGTYYDSRVAIKTLRVYRADDQDTLRKVFCKEVVVWKRLTHANILPLLGVSTTLFPFCMVSPWMKNGNMTEYVRANPEANRTQLLMDVGKGLNFLHSLEIVHGDLKGANILINESRQACLADFGLTTIISNLNSLNISTFVSRPSGTVRWMAPETLDPEMFDLPVSPNRGLSKASDIYAFGMVAIETFTGNLPFQEIRNDPSVIIKVMQGERPIRPEQSLVLGLSDDLWELIQLCWQEDRNNRPSISFVLDRLEGIVYSDSAPPPTVVYKTSLDRTCIGGSDSSVAVPSQPMEASKTATTSRGDAVNGSDHYDSVHTPTMDNSGSKGNTDQVLHNRDNAGFTKWSRKFFHALFPCIIS